MISVRFIKCVVFFLWNPLLISASVHCKCCRIMIRERFADFQGCLTVSLPAIMSIINLSLSTGVVPDALKVVIHQPKGWPSARNLGVIIDQCLDLTDHVNKICVSCQYHLRNIAKIRKYLSEDTSQILVHAFISSKLDNCNSLLYGLPKHLLNRLRLIQNTAARIVTLSKRFDHITPILFKLHWLPLGYRIHFKTLLLVYKCLNGLAPTYLSELLRYTNSPRLLRSSSQNFLALPRTRLKTYGDRAFSAAAPRLWNQLPPELRSVTSVDQFRTQLKTYLFKLAYDVWF